MNEKLPIFFSKMLELYIVIVINSGDVHDCIKTMIFFKHLEDEKSVHGENRAITFT